MSDATTPDAALDPAAAPDAQASPETTAAAVQPSPVDLGEDGPVEHVVDANPPPIKSGPASFADLVSTEHASGHLLQMHAMELQLLGQKAAEFKAAAASFRSKASEDVGAILDAIIKHF